MKRKPTFPSLVIPIFILASVYVTSTLAAILPEHGPSASGAGLFSFRNHLGRTEMWSFSFEAIANKNGHTRGRAQFDNLTAQTQIVIRINCLRVTSEVNSAFAVIGGTVLHSDDPNLPRLQNVLFAASDGPLSPVSTSDTITPPFPFPFAELDCHDTQPLTVLPVEDGDIKIEPSGQTQ